jgi:coatomer protein complex subunit gamma
VLEGVSMLMATSDEGLTEDFIIPADLITVGEPKIVYVSFTRTQPEEFAMSSFECTLKFISKEVDPSTGTPEEEGYDDEYQVEQLDLGAGDVSSLKYYICLSVVQFFDYSL